MTRQRRDGRPEIAASVRWAVDSRVSRRRIAIRPSRRVGSRTAAAAAMLACLAMAAPWGSAAESSPRRRPNIVLILVDDLGWADLGCQGSRYYETPRIDRLAAQGLRLTNGYASCAVCSPTRAAIQTGRYPTRLGITDWIRARFQGGVIGPDGHNPEGYEPPSPTGLCCPRNVLFMELDELTLAEVLKPAGYVSCHIGKWHLGQEAHEPRQQGYDVNHGGCDLGQPPSYFDPYVSSRPDYVLRHLPPRRDGEYLTDREADEAVGFIRANRDRPFLLNLCHYAVHTPLQAKTPLVEKYRAKPPTRQNNPVYAAMIESVDQAVGKIVETIDALGLASDTLIIFTSDNGGLLGSTDNAPLRAGKGSPYEGGIRVPWIVRWPGVVRPGTTCDVPVASIDVLPTAAALAGIDLPPGRVIDGRSLVPLLRGEGEWNRDALFWHFPHYRRGFEPYGIIREGQWKLIRFYDSGVRELYNLAGDPGEQNNLADDMPENVRRLDQRLSAWLAETGARMPVRRAADPQVPGVLDPRAAPLASGS